MYDPYFLQVNEKYFNISDWHTMKNRILIPITSYFT
jgi:hypothetical protein